SSYAARNWAKSIVSAALTLATTSEREPFLARRSIARPRLTCSGTTSAGLPSTSAKELFISGWSRRARTIAKPIRWVKLTLPPRARRRWLLITMRLSINSLAGTARTLVAVGTVRLVSMFATTRAAAPRSGCDCGPAAGPSAGCWPCSLCRAAVRAPAAPGVPPSVALVAAAVPPPDVLPSPAVPLAAVPSGVPPPAVVPPAVPLGPPAVVPPALLSPVGPVPLGPAPLGPPLGPVPLPVPVPVVPVPVGAGPVVAAGLPAAAARLASVAPVSAGAEGEGPPLGAGVVFGGAAVALASESAAGAGAAAPLPPSGSTVRWSEVGRDDPPLSGE